MVCDACGHEGARIRMRTCSGVGWKPKHLLRRRLTLRCNGGYESCGSSAESSSIHGCARAPSSSTVWWGTEILL